jgi:fumarate reductase subunit D
VGVGGSRAGRGSGAAARCSSRILLLLFGVLYPLGSVGAPNYPHLLAVLRHPLTRIVLLALCVLALFHWAHRFRYTLYDGLQLKGTAS